MKKLLIVEDDQIVANIYRNKFTVDGYSVEVASDGETGLRMLRERRPDAMIIDLMLPKMSGVDLLKAVRLEPGCQSLPVIVFSNTYLTNMVQEAWKAGATKCLSKANCTPKQVLQVLRTVLTGTATAETGQSDNLSADASPQTIPSGSNSRTSPELIQSRTDTDEEFQADLQSTFIQSLPTALNHLRTSLKNLVKADGQDARLVHVQDLYRHIHAVTGNAAVCGLAHIAQMADALEALLKELHEKPKNLNASTIRTIAVSVDFLGTLFEHGTQQDKQDSIPANILVVDDEAISRRALTYALEKAKLKCQSVEDPSLAYTLLSEKKYDLIFLDIDMPGMNGFELCTKLRGLPVHKKTPVVFVTSLNDFENRANSSMSGGNDFIAKPFLFMELAVKAVVYVLRGRLLPAAA